MRRELSSSTPAELNLLQYRSARSLSPHAAFGPACLTAAQMADDENEENKQPTLSGVKIDPPDLKFPVTLNKSSKQQLRVSVSSAAENGVTFKIKTTNPKRYSCLLYTSPSPRDRSLSRMPSSA